MSYSRYQGSSSPWASGVPPGAPPPPAMYGHPHHNASHHGPPGYGVPAYGSPNQSWNRGPMIVSPVGGGWSPSNAGQRGGQRNSMGPGPTGKRGSAPGSHWEDGPPMKRMNKGQPNRNNSGNNSPGQWRQNNQQGNRKFQNRNFNNNQRKNQNKNRNEQHEKRQNELSVKALDNLSEKSYPFRATLEDGTTLEEEDKTKLTELDTQHGRYLTGIYGFACKLCKIFIRDKAGRLQHYQTEEHLEKFTVAEEERVQKEKEEAERKAKEAEEKASTDAEAKEDAVADKTATKDAEKIEDGEKAEGDTTLVEESMNGVTHEEAKSEVKEETIDVQIDAQATATTDSEATVESETAAAPEEEAIELKAEEAEVAVPLTTATRGSPRGARGGARGGRGRGGRGGARGGRGRR